MDRLDGMIRSYPWGSRTMIAELQGRYSTDRPEAELWFGAHPGGSATIKGKPLTEIIAFDPVKNLGIRVADQYKNRLPFLLKILAAAEPLSLQAHPSLKQARAGFAAEEARGIARHAVNRNYRDDNHKPELLVALTDFEALAGFRPLQETKQLLDALACPQLRRWTTMVDPVTLTDEENLRALFTSWITIPVGPRTELVHHVTHKATTYLDTITSTRTTADEPWIADVLRTILVLNERYPGDVGVLGALLLNKICLKPGEAVFLAAGELHSYIRGLGVEIMANSDNVLRGGLTAKHVDVPELVKVLHFTPLTHPIQKSLRLGGDSQNPGVVITEYPVPVVEFVLVKMDFADGGDHVFAHDGPAVLMCTAGKITARNEESGDVVVLTPGTAAWVPACDPAITVHATGESQLFTAVTGTK